MNHEKETLKEKASHVAEKTQKATEHMKHDIKNSAEKMKDKMAHSKEKLANATEKMAKDAKRK